MQIYAPNLCLFLIVFEKKLWENSEIEKKRQNGIGKRWEQYKIK